MDSRLFFVLGDLFSNLVIGAVVASICSLIVGTNWNMWLAMVLMMGLGMILATLLWVPLSIYFGAMEVMVPAMLTGMLSGMVVGMLCAMYSTTFISIIFVGSACGLVSIVFVWITNNQLRGLRQIDLQD